MSKRLCTAACLTVALCAGQSAFAAPPFSTFTNLASFQASLAGAPTFTQDFEGLAAGTNLLGVSILPGVTAATTGTTLQVFNSASIGQVMFGSPRTGSEFHYDLNLSSPYNAVAFDIQAFDPRAEPGRLDVFFADATSMSFNIGPGATETTPVFFGIVAGGNIASVRWNEPPEPLTGSCCEETALDNIVVAQAVPEPSEVALLGAGLGTLFGAGWLRRRRS
jgi:hypothetical protein